MPLPDHEDSEVQANTMISFRTEGADKWSSVFKLDSLKRNVSDEENYIVQ